jgi:ABC-2 type transport system permease protein
MGKINTLARRELSAYFYSPMAYVITALFLLLVAVVFLLGVRIPFLRIEMEPVFRSGAESTLRPLLDVLAYGLVVVVPLLTMRLMSEEFRSGTIETLMTAPVTDTAVILGKFLGAYVLYLVLLASTLVFFGLIVVYGHPDFGVAAMGYLGMAMLGGVYVSVGVFSSTLTKHQLVAGLIGIAILAFFTAGVYALQSNVEPQHAPTVAKFNLISYFGNFSKGVLDIRSIVVFPMVTALFLFLSVKVLESKRWR